VPETSLALRSAIASAARSSRHGAAGIPGAMLTELRGIALASLAARGVDIQALSATLEREFGATLPSRPGRTAQGTATFIWSCHNQWLVIGDASGDLVRRLASCVGDLGYVTDLTGSRTIVRISGHRARDGLMKLVPIDLDEEAFSVGSAASTVAVRMPVQIWQIDAQPTYEVAISRSYGISLWHALHAAFAEYGCETGK